jgi:hypothetical protein
MNFDHIEPFKYLSSIVFIESTPPHIKRRPNEGTGLLTARATIKENH